MFSAGSDGISADIVRRTQAIKPDASASSNKPVTVNFSDPYALPQNDSLKRHLTEQGPVQNELPEYSQQDHLVASI
jgi:hypothetical protein